MQKVIISILGKDRPGIIAAVSRRLLSLDFNIENVSQTILQSQFSGIFIAAAPQQQSVETLEKQLKKELGAMNLHVFLKALPAEEMDQAPPCEPFVVTAQGPDRKGLVAGITAVLARYHVNVTNLQALFKGGDDPSANIMIYEVDIPVDADLPKLRAELQATAAQLDLTLSIIHKNIFEAINRP